MTTVAVDVMGCDSGVGPVVDGALLGAARDDLQVRLVGRETDIQDYLDGKPLPARVSIQPASDVIEMGEEPLASLRQKRDSSIVVAAKLVRDGQADAFVSPGNTGAVMAAGTVIVGRIKGVDRPAIATLMPSLLGSVLVLDAGANVDCRPGHLLQFAQMGSLYAERIMGRPSPSVGLLSVGEEETKGDKTTKEAHRLIRDSVTGFVGNVEGRDIAQGKVDVVVCDGFVGNVVLKTAEGFASFFVSMLKAELTSNLRAKLGAVLLKPALERFRKKLDYAEYGGAPLLGTDGVCIIAHGSSNSRAVANAIGVAATAVENKLVQTLTSAMAREAATTQQEQG